MGSKYVVRLVAGIGMGVAMLLAFAVMSYASGAGGAAVYGQYCAGCHGENGQGTAYGPDIAGESSSEVYKVTRKGDDEMPAYGPSLISDEELAALAQYVGALSRNGSADNSSDDESSDDDDSDVGDHDDASQDQYDPEPKPGLTLKAKKSNWKNLSAYQDGILTVVYEIENHSGSDASMVKIISPSSTSGGVQLVTTLPLSIGEVRLGEHGNFKLEYMVPAGTHSYRTILHATAMTDDGNTHHYPVEVSDSD